MKPLATRIPQPLLISPEKILSCLCDMFLFKDNQFPTLDRLYLPAKTLHAEPDYEP
jgi:hypothetical protein